MNDQNNSVENFIKLVRELRLAQKDPAIAYSRNVQGRAARLANLVDAWLVARALDEKRFEAFTGQKVN